MRRQVKMFLAPNQFIREKSNRAIPGATQVVIGTPKLDKWVNASNQLSVINGRKPVVAISFHWNGEKVSAEAGNAFLHYRDILSDLANDREFTLIGHGHPKYMFVLEKEFTERGIEVVHDFDEVMQRADVYVNDCSSTLYEFCVTGKPVIIMNAPWFRKDLNLGIRFWSYTDIGPQVNDPGELRAAIGSQLSAIGGDDLFACSREKMVQDLYPYLGFSAQRAAGAILGFVGGKQRG
jgi:CDP-glycerol glycerophosphotransferase (TagB/SpsB family)